MTDPTILTEQETRQIIVNFLNTHGPAGEDEVAAVLEAAQELAFAAACFELLLNNQVGIQGVADGKLLFKPLLPACLPVFTCPAPQEPIG